MISFNEASQKFYEMVQECDWVRDKYWMNYYSPEKKGFSNMLLTKIKPLCFHQIKIKKLPRPAEIAFFHLKNKKKEDIIVSFTSVHLIAFSTNN